MHYIWDNDNCLSSYRPHLNVKTCIYPRGRREGDASRSIHLGGDCGPWLLDVELRRVLRLALAIARHDRVEPLILIGHVADDERVAPALLHDVHVLAVGQLLVYRLEMRCVQLQTGSVAGGGLFQFQFVYLQTQEDSFSFKLYYYRHGRLVYVSVK